MLYTFLTVIQGESAQNVMVRAHISVPQICIYRISAGFSKPLWSHQFSHNHTGFSESAINENRLWHWNTDGSITIASICNCVAAQTESDVNSDVLVTLQTVVIGH